MTVMAERALQTPQMSVGEFERIAAFAAKETDDAVRLEFINGRIGVECSVRCLSETLFCCPSLSVSSSTRRS